MSFALSKIAWALLQPSSVMLLLVAIGVALTAMKRFARAGRRLAFSGLAMLVVAGFGPVANHVILPLEQRFPIPSLPGDGRYSGIVVLGGAEIGDVGQARGQLSLNEAAERVTEGLRLAHLLPDARLVFTGGASRILRADVPGAGDVAAFWRAAGIATSRIVVEDQSLTTWENAKLTHTLLKPSPGERFLLVTSAHHMPRAVGAFRKVGFDVVAYPCDFRTVGPLSGIDTFDAFPKGLRRLDDTAKEWVGLIAYWLTGRSSAVFPGP
jgi:uncharacterized SAM-binding protein YcdF (DUF218 family)